MYDIIETSCIVMLSGGNGSDRHFQFRDGYIHAVRGSSTPSTVSVPMSAYSSKGTKPPVTSASETTDSSTTTSPVAASPSRCSSLVAVVVGGVCGTRYQRLAPSDVQQLSRAVKKPHAVSADWAKGFAEVSTTRTSSTEPSAGDAAHSDTAPAPLGKQNNISINRCSDEAIIPPFPLSVGFAVKMFRFALATCRN
jgi:hypothetical protein